MEIIPRYMLTYLRLDVGFVMLLYVLLLGKCSPTHLYMLALTTIAKYQLILAVSC